MSQTRHIHKMHRERETTPVVDGKHIGQAEVDGAPDFAQRYGVLESAEDIVAAVNRRDLRALILGVAAFCGAVAAVAQTVADLV